MKINLQEHFSQRQHIIEWAIIHMMTKREAQLNLPEWKFKRDGGADGYGKP